MRSLLAVTIPMIASLSAATAQTVPTGFTIDTLATTLAQPNDCCFLPDGRCLVANSAGNVSIYAGGATVSIGTVPNVLSGGELGLLSIAADPGFATNGYLYVYYSSTADSFMHLDRFTCTGDLAIAGSTNVQLTTASRHVLLGTLPNIASNHNGGSARFGPDGMLYLSCGDDANSCNAQVLTSQAGCLLRLDVSARPAGGNTVLPAFSALDPGTNPLSANTDFSQLLIAHGLRNPFRVEIDPSTGNLYIGDVGLSSAEEYSEYVYPASGPLPLINFGWPWREGNLNGSGCGGSPPLGLVDPIGVAPRSTGWSSVMGGARYRNLGGSYDFGSGYEGSAFYADYFAGQVRRMVNTGTWSAAPPVPGQPTTVSWGTGFNSLTSLRLGPDGGLWFTQHPGSLKRIRLLGPTPSVVVVSGDHQRVAVGDPFPNAIVARALDTSGNPLANGIVNFTVAGGGTLSAATVTTDANGIATTTAIALATPGGTITVTATTPGAISPATFALFARKLTAIPAAQLLVLTISNQTDAVPAQVPFILFASFAGSPTVPTPIGPFCIDPGYPLAFLVEDGTGFLGGISLSGSGGVGTPTLTRIYNVPPGALTGQLMSFQALGLDPLTGWFRTNCEQRQF